MSSHQFEKVLVSRCHHMKLFISDNTVSFYLPNPNSNDLSLIVPSRAISGCCQSPGRELPLVSLFELAPAFPHGELSGPLFWFDRVTQDQAVPKNLNKTSGKGKSHDLGHFMKSK